MGVIRRMGKQGDIPTKWELDDEGSVKQAQSVFDDAMRAKMLAFNMDEGGGEQIKSFDPKAREIVLIPQIAGGN